MTVSVLAEEENESGPIGEAVAALIVIGVCAIFFPHVMPFKFTQFWHIHGNPSQWLSSVWVLFAWGIGITAVHALFSRNDPHTNRDAEEILVVGSLLSLWAGVSEEIAYRWLCFLAAIPMMKLLNLLFFKWFFGFGLLQWLQLKLLGPVADYASLHHLHHYLFSPYGWAVGAAMLSANATFRDGHRYQGLFGWLNSWFCGLVFFWVMFHYGLVAAILVHLLYDLFIFVVAYIDAAVERKLGWT